MFKPCFFINLSANDFWFELKVRETKLCRLIKVLCAKSYFSIHKKLTTCFNCTIYSFWIYPKIYNNKNIFAFIFYIFGYLPFNLSFGELLYVVLCGIQSRIMSTPPLPMKFRIFLKFGTTHGKWHVWRHKKSSKKERCKKK